MLELSTTAAPAHWLTAVLPQAPICQLQGDGLLQLTTASITPVSAPLRHALGNLPVTRRTIVAVDPTGAHWRLRRPHGETSEFWLLQSLSDSRRLSLQNFRTAFAARLANSLLHELRNPLNALGLQCDLLGRTLKPAASAEVLVQTAGRVVQMKERLRDLLERQNSMVGLWLSDPQPAETRPELAALVDESLRLLRSYGAQREVRLQAEDLSALGLLTAPGNSIPIRIVLIAIGLLAIDSAAVPASEDASIGLYATAGADTRDGTAARLEIRAQFAAAALPAELQFADIDEWLATLALLLDGQPIALVRSVDGIELRFLPR